MHLYIALPYITWGLIWDLKNRKKKEIPIENKIVSGIPKLRRVLKNSCNLWNSTLVVVED